LKRQITLHVNQQIYELAIEPDTPLLYVLRNNLGLKGPKYGCASEQCGACKVLVDGSDVPSCQLPVSHVEGLEIVTIEGLGTIEEYHPLQQAFIEEGAIQCGYCAPGMIIAAQ
jgi:aerobic-type carbon monoxide dehydrogenase small subunit (CoxS/CutS family)